MRRKKTRKNYWLERGAPPAKVTRARPGFSGEGRPVSDMLRIQPKPMHTNPENPTPNRPNPRLLHRLNSCSNSTQHLILILTIRFSASWRMIQHWAVRQLWRGGPSYVLECAPSFRMRNSTLPGELSSALCTISRGISSTASAIASFSVSRQAGRFFVTSA